MESHETCSIDVDLVSRPRARSGHSSLTVGVKLFLPPCPLVPQICQLLPLPHALIILIQEPRCQGYIGHQIDSRDSITGRGDATRKGKGRDGDVWRGESDGDSVFEAVLESLRKKWGGWRPLRINIPLSFYSYSYPALAWPPLTRSPILPPSSVNPRSHPSTSA